MNASLELLDRYKKARKLGADNAAAEALGITRATVSGWRHSKSHPDAESVAKMCEATGDSVAHWLPLIEAERARNPEARKVWLKLAQLAAAVVLAVNMMPAHSAPISGRITGDQCLLCQIMEGGSGRLARDLLHYWPT